MRQFKLQFLFLTLLSVTFVKHSFSQDTLFTAYVYYNEDNSTNFSSYGDVFKWIFDETLSKITAKNFYGTETFNVISNDIGTIIDKCGFRLNVTLYYIDNTSIEYLAVGKNKYCGIIPNNDPGDISKGFVIVKFIGNEYKYKVFLAKESL